MRGTRANAVAWVLFGFGVVCAAAATALTILWTLSGGVFAGVLITYPLGGLGGALAGYGGLRLAMSNPGIRNRVPIEILGGVAAYVFQSIGYVAVSPAVDFGPLIANTLLPGVLVAVGATVLVEASVFAIGKLSA